MNATTRAAMVFAGSLAAQLLFLYLAGELLAVEVAFVNTALLLGSTTLLGHVWGLRQHLTRTGLPALSATLVPLVTCALFVSPRLATGAPPDAVLTIAACAALVGPTELAWSSWVTPRPPACVYGIRVLAPVASVALLALSVSREVAVVATCGAGVLVAGAAAFRIVRAARRMEREVQLYTRHIRLVEVRLDSLVIPPEPDLTDPWLLDLARNLEARARDHGREARESAKAEAEIADARQLRTRFMASMSHELRSPLNSIVGFSQILEDGLDGELRAGQAESVAMIRRSAEELMRLLTDTLDLARIEAGKLRLHRAWVPSVEILTEALARGRALVEGREVEIEAELQPGLPPVYVDSRRIVQAVVALFRHAARSLSKATVRLRTRIALGPPGPDRHLRIEFYDAIGALPQEEVERIFEAFQEITEPTGRRVGGLGMALSLSRALVRLHGGDVWASTAPGAGTVLCVALPLDDAEPAP